MKERIGPDDRSVFCDSLAWRATNMCAGILDRGRQAWGHVLEARNSNFESSPPGASVEYAGEHAVSKYRLFEGLGNR